MASFNYIRAFDYSAWLAKREIKKIYREECKKQSDINEHLPTLRRYAQGCRHVTEFGARDVVSTWALLAGFPGKVIAYDLFRSPNVELAARLARKARIDFSFIQGNILELEIEPTDLLFIDTFHEYNQLKSELHLHAGKVRKFIILHDTTLFEVKAEDKIIADKYGVKNYSGKGLWLAVEEFLKADVRWAIKKRYTNNNGLTILERIRA